MVRDGEYPSLELAVCCNVEVIKGARGARFCSLSSMSTMRHLSFLAISIILSTSFLSRDSFEQVKVSRSAFGVFQIPSMTQKVSGINQGQT
jgi:hypothetical protein